MMTNEFISIDVLSTMAGCSLVITLLTQVFKRYLPENVNTKWLALIFSVIIGILRIFYVHRFDFDGIVVGVLNIFVLLAASIGIYEIAHPVAKDLQSKWEGNDDKK